MPKATLCTFCPIAPDLPFLPRLVLLPSKLCIRADLFCSAASHSMVTTQANGRPAVAGQDRRPSLVTLAATLAPAWLPLLTLIFGGCCSNAVFLELSTRQAPQLGTLITLLQFFFTMLLALPAQLERHPSSSPKTSSTGEITFVGWRLKTRAVPMSRWAVQVVLYATTSLLNNVAFAYEVPMPVHIIFRSGGLVVNMLMGWVVRGRR